jgi:predicted nucleic acid-binding protein
VSTAYVDASALVKLVVDERDAVALRRFLEGFDEHTTSRVGIVETRRALARVSTDPTTIDRIMAPIGPIEFDTAIAATAALIQPPAVRTLDAIHLATALALYHVDAFVTYDEPLAEAARSLGFAVASPT